MTRPTYRRTQPIAAYLMLLLMSIGGYFLYSASVVPLIEIPTVKRRAPVDTSSYETMEGNSEHHVWFTEGDWEKRPCAVLLTTNGKILFDDCERVDPTTWIVTPFSMVLDRSANPEDPNQALPPIILRSEKGARLKLEQPVSAFSNSDVTLKSAELEGAVELYRRSDLTSMTEDLRIKTSNVLIEHQTVSTIDDVAFWFGNNHGMGRQMTISLSKNANATASDLSDINGITHLRLGLLSSMQLNPGKSKDLQNQKLAAPKERMLSTDGSPVQIQTNGDFEFDFIKNIARFRDSVQVRKMDKDGDTLLCDELLLKFAAAGGKKVLEIDAASDNEYELKSIVAKGSPATLNAYSQNAQIRSEFLKYDLLDQILQAADPKQVSLVQEDTQFVAKSIQYQLTDDGRIGQMSAAGPGQILKNDPQRPFRASWAKTLTIDRKNDQQHLIRLQGKSTLDLGADSQLTANRINLTVWEVPVLDANGNFVRWSHQPAELNAKKRVHVSSDKIIADSEELIASWPANPRPEQDIPEQPQRNINDQQPEIQSNIELSNLDLPYGQQKRTTANHAVPPSHPVGLTQRQPNFRGAQVRRVNYEFQQAEKKMPLIASGELIRITVEDQNQQSKIKDLEMIGNVTVKKPSAINPDAQEFTVTGNSLRMTPQDQKHYRVQVTGSEQFAKIETDRFEIEGADVFLDQVGNRMWIKGQGKVVLDPRNVKKQIPLNARSQPNQKPSKLNISFAGGMIFDGQNIYFEHEIVANIKENRSDGISQTRATGNALKIVLDRRVNFSDLDDDNKNSDPQILEMIFRSELNENQTQFKFAGHKQSQDRFVTIENLQTNLEGKTVEKFKLISPHAVMNRTSDQLTANGPGGIEIYRQGKPGKPSDGFGFVGDAAARGTNGSVTYIHTHFDRQLISGLESKNLAITGNTRSIYAPLGNFDLTIDPSQPTNAPEGSVRLFCDRIDLVQSNNPLSPRPRSQFTATGNAQLGADRFFCKGDRISYREDNENLVIERLTGKNVILRRRSSANSRFDQGLVGARVIYNVRTKTAEAENVESMSGSINKRP